MEIPILNNIVVIFGLTIGVLFVCHKLHIPAVVGFLITGIFVGPYGIGLIKDIHEVEIFAEVGVVLLLFTIGIEFSLERLLQIRKSVLMGGSLQVLITSLAAFFIARIFDQTFGKAVFISFFVTLSSTSIVLKLIHERAEVDSPHGRTILGVLIFQDIIVIPMILLTPILAGAGGSLAKSVIILSAKGIGIILFTIVSAKWIVPRLLYQITKTRNNELFLLSMVVICFGIAWLTSKAGLSLGLGAFLAGLIISESEYSHHALGNILPFRDVFTTFFFVSIGMMLDLGFLFQELGLIFLITVGVIIVKALISGGVTILLGLPLRTAILAGFSLAQIGEFSFILSKTGVEYGLFTGDIYQRFLAAAILSMAATPFIIKGAPKLAQAVHKLPVPKRLLSEKYAASEKKIDRKDHLVIIGFGINGRNLARAARVAGIPYAIIETNPDTVRSEQAKGEPIYYGDASYESVLHIVNVERSRIGVVAINDPTATRRITEQIRRINPKIHLLVRTRYLQEMKSLYNLGANEVIPEEFETSVEIFARVLTKYLIPRDQIEKLITEIRADGYETFRNISAGTAYLSDLKLELSDIEISTLRILPGSRLIGKSLAEIEMRKQYGVSAAAIRRGSHVLPNPGADTVFEVNDIVFIFGTSEKIAKAISEFSA